MTDTKSGKLETYAHTCRYIYIHTLITFNFVLSFLPFQRMTPVSWLQWLLTTSSCSAPPTSQLHRCVRNASWWLHCNKCAGEVRSYLFLLFKYLCWFGTNDSISLLPSISKTHRAMRRSLFLEVWSCSPSLPHRCCGPVNSSEWKTLQYHSEIWGLGSSAPCWLVTKGHNQCGECGALLLQTYFP